MAEDAASPSANPERAPVLLLVSARPDSPDAVWHIGGLLRRSGLRRSACSLSASLVSLHPAVERLMTYLDCAYTQSMLVLSQSFWVRKL